LQQRTQPVNSDSGTDRIVFWIS